MYILIRCSVLMKIRYIFKKDIYISLHSDISTIIHNHILPSFTCLRLIPFMPPPSSPHLAHLTVCTVPGVDPKSLLCQYFKAGMCKKGDKCKFSHDLAVARKVEKRNVYQQKDEDGKTIHGILNVCCSFHLFKR